MALLFGNKRVVGNTIKQEHIEKVQIPTLDDLRHLKISYLVKKVDPSNIQDTIRLLLLEDLICCMKTFCFAVLECSMDSPDSIPSLALLVASINVKLPDIGFVLLKRIVQEVVTACQRKYMDSLKILSELLAQLVNLPVVYDVLAAQFLMVLLEMYDDEHCMEVAASFILGCGYVLHNNYPSVLDSVFQRLIDIYRLKDTQPISRRKIDSLFLIRKYNFDDFKVEIPEFYLAKLDDQIIHEIPLGFRSNPSSLLDVLKAHLDFIDNDNDGAHA